MDPICSSFAIDQPVEKDDLDNDVPSWDSGAIDGQSLFGSSPIGGVVRLAPSVPDDAAPPG